MGQAPPTFSLVLFITVVLLWCLKKVQNLKKKSDNLNIRGMLAIPHGTAPHFYLDKGSMYDTPFF